MHIFYHCLNACVQALWDNREATKEGRQEPANIRSKQDTNETIHNEQMLAQHSSARILCPRCIKLRLSPCVPVYIALDFPEWIIALVPQQREHTDTTDAAAVVSDLGMQPQQIAKIANRDGSSHDNTLRCRQGSRCIRVIIMQVRCKFWILKGETKCFCTHAESVVNRLKHANLMHTHYLVLKWIRKRTHHAVTLQ